MVVAGVDGCRGGWFVVRGGRRPAWAVLETLGAVMDWLPKGAVVGVDIPIGLPDAGARECDVAVRRRLGPRKASVFPAPIRPVLAATTYAQACERRSQVEGRRMSVQAWNLVGKIREADGLLRSRRSLRDQVHEVHPELSFAEMAGHPMRWPKRDPRGRAERLARLTEVFGAAPGEAVAWRRGRGCAPDDVLDAFAALWSAGRIARGIALCVPARPPRDAAGLPMRIMA